MGPDVQMRKLNLREVWSFVQDRSSHQKSLCLYLPTNPRTQPLLDTSVAPTIVQVTVTATLASGPATLTSQFPHDHQRGLHHAPCSQAPPRTEPKALVTAHQGLRDVALVRLSVLSLLLR